MTAILPGFTIVAELALLFGNTVAILLFSAFGTIIRNKQFNSFF